MARITPSPMTYSVHGMDGYIFPGSATIEPTQQGMGSITMFFFSRHCSPYPLQLICPIELTIHLDANWQDRSKWRYVLIEGAGEFKWHREGPRLDLQIQVNITSILELPDRSQHYLPRHILDWALIWLPNEINIPIEESVSDEDLLADISRQRIIERLVLCFRHYRNFVASSDLSRISMDDQLQQSAAPLQSSWSSTDAIDTLLSSDNIPEDQQLWSVNCHTNIDQVTDDESISMDILMRRMSRTLDGMDETLAASRTLWGALETMYSNSLAIRMQNTAEELPSVISDTPLTASSLTFVDPCIPKEDQQKSTLLGRVLKIFRI